MAKISELPVAGPLTGEEAMPIVQGGAAKQVPFDTVLDEQAASLTALANEKIDLAAGQVALATAEADRAQAAADMFDDVRAAVEGAGLPYPAEYEAEAEAYFAAAVTAGSPRSDGQKYIYNRWIKKWKDAGIYSAIRALWIMDNTLTVSALNAVNPGTYDMINTGTGPSFTSVRVGLSSNYLDTNMGAYAASSFSYWDTQIPLSSIDEDNFCIGFFGRNTGASATWDFGNGDGTAGFGINVADTGNSNRPTVRAMGTSAAVPAPAAPYTYSNSGRGMMAVQRRNDAANFEMIHDGMIKNVVASTAVASVSAGTLKVGRALNITSGASTYRFRAVFVLSRGLTADELGLFYRGLRMIIFSNNFGCPAIRHADTAPSKVVADQVIYGWTLQGALCAYEAARQGLDVALVGGWDDHTLDDLGGVSGGGLGAGDIDYAGAISGVMDRVLKRAFMVAGTGSGYNFAPATMNLAVRELLDKARTGYSGTITLYEANGIVSAQTESLIEDERRITSIRCADGTVFEAEYFADASYEGDLAYIAGVTTTYGTGTAGTGVEEIGGFVGRVTEETDYGANGDGPQATNTNFDISPYVVAGNPASGLLPGVQPDGGWVKGEEMKTVQAYCFRQTFTINTTRMRPLPTVEPDGYDPTRYTILDRYFTTAVGLGLTPTKDNLFRDVPLADNYRDFNNSSYLTTDMYESGTRFVQAATYRQRRALKDEFMSFTEGLIYHLWTSPSSTVTPAIRTVLNGYSYACDHYLDPGPNDKLYQASTLYVREARRIIGELVWTANDLIATDGTVPRSTRTVACASYAADSHNHFLYADTSTGTAIIRGANHMFFSVNGVNKISPLPREIFLPKREEAANLCVLFAGSWTHVAHGSIRMEFTSGQAAQSFGMLSAIAHENGGQAYMDVDDATFRTRMAALPETVPAYLPQAN